jgi:GT2 family glycosyltransferase
MPGMTNNKNMEQQYDLTIVIVNYKVRDLVRRLLFSIETYVHGISYEVFLVDNASNDGIIEMATQEFPEVQVIANTENLGFAKANNQAIKRSKGRHILLLNPDTELIENTPESLVRFADEHPNAGVVGCKILNPDRTVQKSVLQFPTPLSQALIMLKLHHVLPKVGAIQRYFYDAFDGTKTQVVAQVMGSAFLMTRKALDRFPGLDERYFIWFEEVDYCKTVDDAGMEVWYVAETALVHHGGQSFAQVLAPKKQRFFNTSLAQYMEKHFGRGAWLLIKTLDPFSMALAWGVGVLGLRRKKYA